MKSLLILSVLILSVSSNLWNIGQEHQLSVQKRQTNGPTCYNYQCLGDGAACNFNPCAACTNALQACSTNAGINGTLLCACYKTAVSCLQNIPSCISLGNSVLSQCPTLFNGGLFGNCTCGNTVAPPAIVTESLCYQDTSYCNTVSGLCTPHSQSGHCLGPNDYSTCGSSSSYIFGPSYYCSNATGTPTCSISTGNQAAGDGCTVSTDCVSNIPCVSGICQGLATGTACQNSNACAYGLYCSNAMGTCQPNVALGGACTQTDACGFTATCGYSGAANAGKCVPLFGNAVGSNCLASSSECPLSAYCNIKGGYQPFSVGVCTASLSNNIPCNNNTDCASYGASCQCLASGAKVCIAFSLGEACTTQANNVISCMPKYNCKGFGYNSCGSKNCANQLSCYYKCAYSDPLFVSAEEIGCFKTPIASSIPCSGTSTTYPLWILLVTVLVWIKFF